MCETREFNVVLIGQTGAGKSTTINNLANVLRRESFDAALAGEPVCIIPTAFSFNDDQNARHVISVDSIYPNSNESMALGESGTLAPMTYTFVQDNVRINFIDLPGVGDTGRDGTRRDEENLKLITKKLEQFERIHAVWYVIRNEGNKLTTETRYCFDSSFAFLPRAAVRNLSIIFTYSRSKEFQLGDMGDPLATYLDGLKRNHGVAFDLANQVHCIDNEAYRFLVGCRTSDTFKTRYWPQMEHFRRSWDKSQEVAAKLIGSVYTACPDSAASFADLGNARFALSWFIDFHRHALDVIRSAGSPERLQQIRRSLEQGQLLSVGVRVDNRYPTLQCTACKVGGQDKICHDKCDLQTRFDVKGDDNLRQCIRFDVGGRCKLCTCSFATHVYKSPFKPTTETTATVGRVDVDKVIAAYVEALNKTKTMILIPVVLHSKFLQKQAVIGHNAFTEEILKKELQNLSTVHKVDQGAVQTLLSEIQKQDDLRQLDAAMRELKIDSNLVSKETIDRVMEALFLKPPMGQALKLIYDTKKATPNIGAYDFEPFLVTGLPAFTL